MENIHKMQEVRKTNKSKFIKAPVAEKKVEIPELTDDEKRVESIELHKPVLKNFLKKSIVTLGIDDLWAVDLIVMPNYEKENDGYKYILNVIDTFSNFVCAEPLKKKDGKETSTA